MTIYDEFIRQRGALVREGREPRSVVFSATGFMKAMREVRADGVQPAQGPTYGGLPHAIDNEQTEDVVVNDKTVEERFTRPAVSFRVDHLKPHQTTMEVAGQALTRAQLSDLLSAWVDAHPDEHLVTTPLVDWIQTHGRFE
jgi:hypothetical protein